MLTALPEIPLFLDLTTKQATLLRAMFEDFNCQPGTVIFEQGEPATYLYLILTGKVILTYKPYDGPRITLTRLKDGDVFGWSAIVGGNKYSSSVVSETGLKSIRIDRNNFLSLLTDQPDTGETIINRLALNVSPRWKNALEQIKPFIHTERISHGSFKTA